MRNKFLILAIFFNINLFAQDKIFAICSDAKSEFIKLEEGSKNGYKNDSMELIFTINEDMQGIFVNGTKLHKLGSTSNSFQLLEPVSSGHYVLYTLHTDLEILTIQKSYRFFNDPVMVNAYLKCK